MKVSVLALLLLGVCACGSVARPGSPPAASPSPLSVAELQYRLIDTLGPPVTCSVTQGPVVRTEDPAQAAAMVADLRERDPAEFDAIARHEHLDATRLSPGDDVRILGQASQLAAVKVAPKGGRYDFTYVLAGPPTAQVTGTIEAAGAISVTGRAPAPRRLCPV